MRLPRKLSRLIHAKPKSPDYTPRQLIFKCVLLFTCAIALDVVGQKIRSIELAVYYYQIPAYGADYYFYIAVSGLLIGLGTWRLLELYWFGKEKVQKLHASMDV